MDNDFISYLCKQKIMQDYSVVLDWLFNDGRVACLDKNQKTKLIKQIKRMDGIGKNNYQYGPIKQLIFPSQYRKKEILILSSKRDTEISDFLRHIRNSIAHKNLYIINIESRTYIQGIDKSSMGQNFFIHMPLNYLLEIYNCYCKILKEKKKHKVC